MVSHEMRTPLTSIIGYAELLGDFEAREPLRAGARLPRGDRAQRPPRDAPRRRPARARADRGRDVQRRAGGDRADRGRTAGRRCGGAARRAAEGDADGEPRAARRERSATRTGSARSSTTCSRTRSSSPPRAARSTFACAATDERPRSLEVADTGIGIPEDEQEKLFDRLYRASSATDRHIPGLGLGLTIVKAIVEAHGGAGSRSRASEGEGTTFRVELPLRQPPSKPISEPGARRVRRRGHSVGWPRWPETGMPDAN